MVVVGAINGSDSTSKAWLQNCSTGHRISAGYLLDTQIIHILWSKPFYNFLVEKFGGELVAEKPESRKPRAKG